MKVEVDGRALLDARDAAHAVARSLEDAVNGAHGFPQLEQLERVPEQEVTEMKVEVDVQLLRDAKRMIFEEVVSGYGRSGRAAFGAKIVDAFTGAITEAEQRAAAERVRTALDDIANVLMALKGPRDSVSLDEGERALRQIHDIAAGVLGKGEVLDRGDVRSSKNDVEHALNAIANASYRIEEAQAILTDETKLDEDPNGHLSSAMTWLKMAYNNLIDDNEADTDDR